MLNTKNLETIKDLLIKYASVETIVKALIQYMDDMEPSLNNDDYILNKFYVLENNNDNFQLLIDEFDIKTFEQIEQTYLFSCSDDKYIQPMKYLTQDKKWIWIIRSLSKKSYYKIINNNRTEIINELMKHYDYINWYDAMMDILEGDIIND